MTPLDEIAAERRIRCGDVVRHRPSDEEWLVAYADYESGYLSWAGWPEGRALIAECELIDARSDEMHLEYVRAWLKAAHSADHRSAAVRRLYPETVAEIERLDRLSRAAEETTDDR